jgi:NADPH2:quinone reductase
MDAIVVAPADPSGFAIRSVPPPTPATHEALVEVETFSLIDRDLRYAPAMVGDGGVWGFDAVGTVRVAAVDGSGPPSGRRVAFVTQKPGTWQQQVAVAGADLATVPDRLDGGPTSAMAVPAVSAWQALPRLGELRGRALLVTGGTGAVAWYTIQFAATRGADVVALTRDPGAAATLRGLGATDVITDLDVLDRPVDAAIDVVGGSTLVRLFDALAEGGTVISVGAVADGDATFGPRAFLGRRRAIESFWGTWPMGSDLAQLLELVGTGELRQQPVTDAGDWRDYTTAVARLADRTITGKAVLHIPPPGPA